MKRLILLFTLSLFSITTFAQQRTVQKRFKVSNDQKLDLNLKFGKTIVVEAWDKNEVSFNADIEINQGKLNNALELKFEEENGSLTITADYDKEKLKNGKATDCPGNDYSKYSWSNNSNHYVACSDITYKLLVPANINIAVESISGDIELVNVTGPIRAKSISGFVDLSWPSGRPAEMNLKTISGEAFTDIDSLKLTNKKDHIPLVGYEIKGTIGTGGPVVLLESISGNIYLREG